MKVNFVVDVSRRTKGHSFRLPSILVGPSSQQLREINNPVYVGDCSFVNQLSASERYDLVKEINAYVMRKISLLNQLVIDLEEFLAPYVLS